MLNRLRSESYTAPQWNNIRPHLIECGFLLNAYILDVYNCHAGMP